MSQQRLFLFDSTARAAYAFFALSELFSSDVNWGYTREFRRKEIGFQDMFQF